LSNDCSPSLAIGSENRYLNKGGCLWRILFSDFQKLLTHELRLLPCLIMDSRIVQALDSSLLVHTQARLVSQKQLLAFFIVAWCIQ